MGIYRKIKKTELTNENYKKLKSLVEIEYENDAIILIDKEEWEDFELTKESKEFKFLVKRN